MLFLGLGTGLGSTMIVNGVIAPMELGHLPYKKRTYEDYVGRAGLQRLGKAKWRRYVADVVTRLIAALEPDETVIGGGNVKKLAALPPRVRMGDNANALRGGFRLWHESDRPTSRSKRRPGRSERIADGFTIEGGYQPLNRQARRLA
jgi:polyphosphate glucokinase